MGDSDGQIWVQFDRWTAKIYESDYAHRIYWDSWQVLRNRSIIALVYTLIAAPFSFAFFPGAPGTSLAFIEIKKFIETHFLAGEPLSPTLKLCLYAGLYVVSMFPPILALSFGQWLLEKVKDEFWFDRRQGTVSHRVQSRLAYILGRCSSPKVYQLADFCQVALDIKKECRSIRNNKVREIYYGTLRLVSRRSPPGGLAGLCIT